MVRSRPYGRNESWARPVTEAAMLRFHGGPNPQVEIETWAEVGYRHHAKVDVDEVRP